MQIPSDWQSAKRPRGGRVRCESGRKRPRHVNKEDFVSESELCSSICTSILNSKSSHLPEVNFSTILSDVSYREILGSLFKESPSVGDVPIVTKSFEEAYMREPLASERKCVMGLECECNFIDRKMAFVGVEFLLPSQNTGNCDRQMCVLCSRKHTQKLFYDMMHGMHRQHYGVIQRYGVIGGVPLEYSMQSLLIMPPSYHVQCMPHPSVAHCRSNYAVCVRSGMRYIEQKQSLGFQPPSHEPSSCH